MRVSPRPLMPPIILCPLCNPGATKAAGEGAGREGSSSIGGCCQLTRAICMGAVGGLQHYLSIRVADRIYLWLPRAAYLGCAGSCSPPPPHRFQYECHALAGLRFSFVYEKGAYRDAPRSQPSIYPSTHLGCPILYYSVQNSGVVWCGVWDQGWGSHPTE